MKKILLAFILIFSILTVLAGCGSQTHTHSGKDITSSIQSDNKPDKAEGTEIKDSNSTNENSDKAAQSGTSSADKTNTKITKEEAKSIAFKDAGVKESDVYDLDVELDFDGGVSHYDIDFEKGGKEYEYVIDAQSGKILHTTAEKDPISDNNTSKDTKSQNLITKNEAKSIALKDAGLKESDIFDFEIEYDNDGVRKYEIEFKSGKHEYSYDINAKTGIIIKKEIDKD